MIKYGLICEQEHAFEGWFSNSGAFEDQCKAGLVECPHCGSTAVEKALMAPAVSTARKKEAQLGNQVATSPKIEPPSAIDPDAEALRTALRALKEMVKKNADYVGDKFPEEARKIHYGESDPRGIYGEASGEDVEKLVDEGIDIVPLPDLPEDSN